MAGIRTCDRESQVQRPNHYTTEPSETKLNETINENCRAGPQLPCYNCLQLYFATNGRST